MKKILLFVTALTFIVVSKAQIAGDNLNINNIVARINAEGSLFWDFTNPKFEVPKGSGRNTIFAGNIWIGGFDTGGNLKLAGQTYRQTGTDFWPGPLTSSGTTDSITMYAYNRVWKINQCDIDAYRNWVTMGGGPNPVSAEVMDVINTWPGTNPDGGSLAPFFDLNADGIYEPELGEVPKIKGDQAIFFVYNDKGGIHTETGGNSIGVEIQGMAYAYSCSDDSTLYNTIFTNYKIINKSPVSLDSAFIGNWTDFDIGSSTDDYVGCDVARGAYYGYNADAIDDNPLPSQLAYGENPPAQAVVFLNGPWADPNGIDDLLTPNGTNYGDGIADNERLGMSKFLYYNNSSGVTGNPVNASGFYNYMTGRWKDSTSMTYGGTGHTTGVACDYMFPGDSDTLGFGTAMVPQSPWSETIGINPPEDGRVVGSFGPFRLSSGAVETVDFAYVFARATSGGNLASVNVMKERIDSVRHKFSNEISGCGCSISSGIDRLTIENLLNLYPNPATDNLTVNYNSASKNYFIKIYDVTGKLVKSAEAKNVTTLSISDLKDGLYLLNILDGNKLHTKRFVKQ